jgi:hypothetical protein
MLIRNGVLAVSFCFSSASVVFSEKGNAPFGLMWGMTETQVTQLVGVEIKKKVDSDLPLGTTGVLQVTSLPKNLTMAESYYLIFVTEKHLQKIVMYSKDIENDVSGTKGKEMYEKIKMSLRKKYGSPTDQLEVSGLKLWEEWDEFYQCLDYSGCGNWMSAFEDEKSGMIIGLELKGIRRGRGFIQLTYEGPFWSTYIDSKEKLESELDDNAL